MLQGFTGNLRRPLRARLSFVLFFPIFSRFFPAAAGQEPGLSYSPSVANRDSIVFFILSACGLGCGEMTANKDGKKLAGIPLSRWHPSFRRRARPGKAHFRARYKVHAPLIAAARNLRNNVVITWFSAVAAAAAARTILLPGQTREFITSFLFP